MVDRIKTLEEELKRIKKKQAGIISAEQRKQRERSLQKEIRSMKRGIKYRPILQKEKKVRRVVRKVVVTGAKGVAKGVRGMQKGLVAIEKHERAYKKKGKKTPFQAYQDQLKDLKL